MSTTTYLPLVSEHTASVFDQQATETYTWADKIQHQRPKCRQCKLLRRSIAALFLLIPLTGIFAVIYLHSGLFPHWGSEELVPRDLDVGGIVGIAVGGFIGLLVLGCICCPDSDEEPDTNPSVDEASVYEPSVHRSSVSDSDETPSTLMATTTIKTTTTTTETIITPHSNA